MIRLLLMAVLLFAYGCQPAGPVALTPLPEVDLQRFEPGLRERLHTALTAVNGKTSPADAAIWTDTGMMLQAHGIDDAALVCYDNARALQPRYEAVYLSAYLSHQAGDLATASDGYAQAAKLNPSAVAPLLRLGEIHLQQGSGDLARRTFEQALKTRPNLPAALAGLGRVALAGQNYEEAVELLSQALRAQPGADQLHYPLGLAYRGMNDMNRARSQLARRGTRSVYIPDAALDAVMAKKATSQTHVVAGLAALEAGDLQTAAREYRLALKDNPQLPRTHLALAHVLEQLGDFAAAAEHCDRSLALNPADGMAWHQRGRLLERAGDDAAAASAYEAALERAPDALPPREFLADTLMRLGQYEQAAAQYAERLARGDEATARVLYLHGLALIASGQCAAAAQPLQRAFEADQTSAEVAEALIRVRSTCATGDQQQRTATLSLATELFRALPEAAFAEALAMALAADGDFGNAVQLQTRVVESSQGTAFSRALLQGFRGGQPAPQPRPADAPAYRLPRLGDT